MSQVVWNTIIPSTTSGNQLATLLNGFKDAVVSGFSGTSRPSQLQAGGYWVDITNDLAGTWDYKMYDGTQDILIFTIDKTTGTSSIAGSASSFEIFKSSNDTIGAILNLVKERAAGLGQTLTGDYLGELRFRGTQDDGNVATQAQIRVVSTNDTTSSHLGAAIVFEQASTNAAALLEKMRLVDGKLGIGTTTPTESLEVRGNSLNMRVADDTAPVVRKARKKRLTGTGQVLSGDIVAQEVYQSTNSGGTSEDLVKVEITATETTTSSAQGASYIVYTKTNGTSTFVARMTINSAGVEIPVLTIGGVSPELQSNKGVAGGYASLDGTGKVPSAQLPSYVDDVLEFSSITTFPVTGSTGIIYVAVDTNKTYRWSGSVYIEVSPSEVTSVNGFSGAVVLTKSDIGLSNVDNTSDATKNAAVATLTNKTLTSPVINSPTGITKGDVGLGNVDNTSDATKNAAAVSLTNKTIDGSVNTISNLVNASISASAAIARSKLANGTVNAVVFNNGSGVMTDSADVTIGTNSFTLSSTKHIELQAQTDSTTTGANASLATFTAGAVRLTNVSLSSLANIPAGANGQVVYVFNRTGATVNVIDSGDAVGTAANRILTGTSASVSLANNACFIFMYDSTTARWQLVGGTGSGAGGQGGINYITNYNAEAGTTGWAVYNDGSVTNPVDGTGGVATVTLTRTTTNPLRGTASFLITKSATNLLGQGTSYDFTIDAADTGKVLAISFDYSIPSGTYADGDLSVWIYDVTNSTLIQPAPYLLKNSTIKDKFFGEFQATLSTSYRLIIHISSSSASAYTVMMDNVNVGPQGKLYGSAVTDWVSYSPALTAFGTTSGRNVQYRRVGSSLEVSGFFVSGTPTASITHIELPSGLTISSAINSPQLVGHANRSNTANTVNGFTVLANANGTTVSFGIQSVSGNNPLAASAANGIIASGDNVSFEFSIPIAGWGTSQLLSNDADTRVVSFTGIGTGSTQALTASTTNISMTSTKDSHTAWTGSTYVVPVPGDYVCSSFLISGASTFDASVYVNGTLKKFILGSTSGLGGGGSALLENLKAGDIISVRSESSITLSGSANQHISIYKLQGPSQVMASETVSARYMGTTGTTLTTTAAAVVFNTKDWDTHGAYNSSTGVFTAPVSGKYRIAARMLVTVNATVNSGIAGYVYKNSTINYMRLDYKSAWNASVNHDDTIQGMTEVNLLAGETVEVRAVRDPGQTANAINTATNANEIIIDRVGNY